MRIIVADINGRKSLDTASDNPLARRRRAEWDFNLNKSFVYTKMDRQRLKMRLRPGCEDRRFTTSVMKSWKRKLIFPESSLRFSLDLEGEKLCCSSFTFK